MITPSGGPVSMMTAIKKELKRTPTHLKAGTTLVLAPSVLTTALSGMGGLTFFFCQQFFFETLGWSTTDEGELIIADSLSGFVSSLMVTGYIGSLGPAVAHAVRSILHALYLDPVDAPVEVLHPDDEPYQLTPAQRKEWKIIFAAGIWALLVIGSGAFQGVMSVGDAMKRHDALTPERESAILGAAISSAVGLCLAFSAFTLPRLKANVWKIYENSDRSLICKMMWQFLFIDSFHNIKAMFRQRQTIPTEHSYLTTADDLRLNWSHQNWNEHWLEAKRTKRGRFNVASRLMADNLRKYIAVGSTLGFAFFKFYVVDELLRMRYGLNASLVDGLDAISFLALNIMTGLTTGVAIYNTFGEWAHRPDVAKDDNPDAWKLGRKIGWVHSSILAAFMMLGVYMGVGKMLAPLPAAISSIAILLICPNRVADFMSFTAPALVNSWGLQPGLEYKTQKGYSELPDLDADDASAADDDTTIAAARPGMTRSSSFDHYRFFGGSDSDDEGVAYQPETGFSATWP